MTEKEILDAFEQDYKIAKEHKAYINKKIDKWIDLYDGKPYGNEQPNRSPMVWKLVQKQGETLISNLSKPFIAGDQNIMVTPITDKDYYKSKINGGVLTHYHDKVLDKNRFYKDMARVMVKEGTAWIRVGWKRINKKKKLRVGQIPVDKLQELEQQGFRILQKNGDVWIEKDNIIANHPTAEIVKNGRVYTDPIANKSADMSYLIFEYETSIGQMKSQPEIYDESAVAKVAANISDYESTWFQDVESGRKSGSDSFRNHSDNPRKKIKVYEYWTDMDIDGDGVPVPCIAVYAGTKSNRTLMKMKKNPYSFKKIPFVAVPCITDSYSVWGTAPAELTSDLQYFYTMLMRGVADNAAGSNNSQKFVKKGALDAENHRRLMEKEPLVEVNTTENINTAVMDGGFNNIPPSVFNIFQMLDTEAEAMTGISKIMQGVTGAHMNASASNFTATMSMSQIRLLDITQNIAYAMKEVLMMWMSMSLDYLDNDEIKTITGIDIDELKVREVQLLMDEYGITELPEDVQEQAKMIIMEDVEDMFNKEDLRYDIRIKVGTDGVKEVRINQLNMLMQQVGGLSSIVDPMILKDLLAEYAELMEFPIVAENIRDFTPQPDPTAQQERELTLAKLAGEAEKEAALADNAKARAESVRHGMQTKNMTLEAEVGNKYADIAQKYATIETMKRGAQKDEFEAGARAGIEDRKVANDERKTTEDRVQKNDGKAVK